jgi:neutral ceramidase
MARSHIITAVITACLAIFVFWQLALGLLSSEDPAPVRFQSSHGSGRHGHVSEDGEYLLGVGKADITGPVVEINMMGYADMHQVGSGLRQRLYCRAFIIGSTSKPRDRVVYLVLDTQSGDTAVRHGILQGLADLGDEFSIYSKNNVAVTGTHSHAGPGAWLNYLLPQITSKGFDKSSYQAIVDGSLLAIRRAHGNVAPGRLSLETVELGSASINRSPYAYEANPGEERARYRSDVDEAMTILSFDRASDGKPIGMLSWFAVHGTSLYGNNTLISGDNKGVAAQLFERSMVSTNPQFVAGFSQANVGDTSPNVLGAYCEDTGLPCRHNDSTCNGNIKTCHGRGPHFHIPDQGTKSCFEIGRRQFLAAKSLFKSRSLKRLSSNPTVASLHTYVDFANYTFPSPFNATLNLQTCSAALGHSFASGTTDGPGAFDFTQGTTDNDTDSPSLRNPLWKLARSFVHEPTPQQISCQHPKPILLDVGAASRPYAWTPNIVDIQLLRVGPLIIIVSPGEATTMSGRRWRESIAYAAPFILNISNPRVVLGGPANSYTHYIATREEYRVQRYEGASTLYGPHTLEAYINLTLTHLPYLAEGSNGRNPPLPPLPAGPSPPVNTNRSLSFINPVLLDRPPLFKSFGDVISSPPRPSTSHHYHPGDIVSTVFVGANPRNNLRLEGTFAALEKLNAKPTGGSGSTSGSSTSNTETWETVRTDADWSLVFRWRRASTVLGTSEVTIDWEIEDDVDDGFYRMRYFGDAKGWGGTVTPFQGVGGGFPVQAEAAEGKTQK